MSRPFPINSSPAIAIAVLLAFTAMLAFPLVAEAQQVPDCGDVSLTLFAGNEAVYRLPEDYGQRLTVRPDDVVRVVASGLPPAGRVEFTTLLPFGTKLVRSETWSNLIPGERYEIEVDLAEYTDFARGAFYVEVTIFSGAEPICMLDTTAAIDGFGGVAAVGSTAATGVGAGVAVMAVAQAASSANVQVNAQVAVRRRRRHGWRRFMPVVAWRKTIWATITGGITGIFAAIALQQTGQLILDTSTVAGGAAAGGGIALGVNLAWGSLISLVKSSGGRFDDDAEEAVDTVSDALEELDNQGL